MENKFKIEPERKSNEERVKPVAKTVSKSNGTSLFSGMEKKMKLETYFEEGFPVQYLPKILFVMLLRKVLPILILNIISLLFLVYSHQTRNNKQLIGQGESMVTKAMRPPLQLLKCWA